ncbi:MAG: hypothetical protein AAGJ35_00005, partial [Myxococcota bacterium]
ARRRFAGSLRSQKGCLASSALFLGLASSPPLRETVSAVRLRGLSRWARRFSFRGRCPHPEGGEPPSPPMGAFGLNCERSSFARDLREDSKLLGRLRMPRKLGAFLPRFARLLAAPLAPLALRQVDSLALIHAAGKKLPYDGSISRERTHAKPLGDVFLGLRFGGEFCFQPRRCTPYPPTPFPPRSP